MFNLTTKRVRSQAARPLHEIAAAQCPSVCLGSGVRCPGPPERPWPSNRLHLVSVPDKNADLQILTNPVFKKIRLKPRGGSHGHDCVIKSQLKIKPWRGHRVVGQALPLLSF